MANVHFTPHLRQYFDLPEVQAVEATTLGEVVQALEEKWPGIGFYITDEQSHVRQHVAIWIDGQRLEDRQVLDSPVKPESKIYILQALSGG